MKYNFNTKMTVLNDDFTFIYFYPVRVFFFSPL